MNEVRTKDDIDVLMTRVRKQAGIDDNFVILTLASSGHGVQFISDAAGTIYAEVLESNEATVQLLQSKLPLMRWSAPTKERPQVYTKIFSVKNTFMAREAVDELAQVLALLGWNGTDALVARCGWEPEVTGEQAKGLGVPEKYSPLSTTSTSGEQTAEVDVPEKYSLLSTTAAPSVVVAPMLAEVVRRKRPLWAVFIMTVGTLSLYFYIHRGLTWAELKRERSDPGMSPIGHAFAHIVPLFNYLRFLAHMTLLDELLTEAGSVVRVKPLATTFAYVATTVFYLIAGRPYIPMVFTFAAFALFGALAAWCQRGLNAYYDEIAGEDDLEGRPVESVPTRIHWAEWITIVLGTLLISLAMLGTIFPPA